MPGSMSGFVVPNRVGNRKWVGNAFLGIFRPKAQDMGVSCKVIPQDIDLTPTFFPLRR